MSKINLLIIIVTTIFLTQCQENKDQVIDNTEITDIHTDTLKTEEKTTEVIDTVITKDTIPEKVDSIKKPTTYPKPWVAKDFLIDYPKGYEKELLMDMEYIIENWQNTPNPLIAFYKGNDIGDYFHLSFEDENGNPYDFGSGNNSFGEYKLYNKESLDDNPKYLNKKFKVFWDMKASSYPCCSGEYDMVKTLQPSITKLELVK